MSTPASSQTPLGMETEVDMHQAHSGEEPRCQFFSVFKLRFLEKAPSIPVGFQANFYIVFQSTQTSDTVISVAKTM